VREKWLRVGAEIKLDIDDVTRLVQAGLPEAKVARHQPALGGRSNTNIVVELAGPPHRVVLRLYQRDPSQARKEAALDKLLVERKAPVAPMLYFDDTNPVSGHPYALITWVDGHRLESVERDLGPAGLGQLAPSIGKAMATIHSLTFPHTGFFGDDLRIPEKADMGRAGLLAYLKRCLVDGPGGKRLGQKTTTELIAFVEREGNRLDAWLKKPCLTHADFNGSNILVRKDKNGVWGLAAVIDWEFAFSGSPAFDFGNLLRPPLDRTSGFADTLASEYLKAGGTLPEEWRRIARIADLYSWADFLGRPDPGTAVIADARRMIEATIATG
jgi:aminoglycoside phosphotransferase (APT) family kinase protein